MPYVVEPSLGADRVALAFLCDAYDEENLGTEEKPDVRVVLRLHPALAPFKAAILPLSKKLSEKAGEVYDALAKKFSVDFDDTVPSASAIAARMRSARRSASRMTLTVKMTAALPSATVTAWSRSV